MTLEVQAAIEAAAHAIWVFAQMEPEDYSEIEKIITRHVAPHMQNPPVECGSDISGATDE